MKICPYCESELSDTARKCKYCGERLNGKWRKKTGRIDRVKFCVAFGGIYTVFLILNFLFFYFRNEQTFGHSLISIVLSLLLINIILTPFRIRRIHDIGWNGWLSTLYFIIPGRILFDLLLLFWPGVKNTNKYGKVPENNRSEKMKDNVWCYCISFLIFCYLCHFYVLYPYRYLFGELNDELDYLNGIQKAKIFCRGVGNSSFENALIYQLVIADFISGSGYAEHIYADYQDKIGNIYKKCEVANVSINEEISGYLTDNDKKYEQYYCIGYGMYDFFINNTMYDSIDDFVPRIKKEDEEKFKSGNYINKCLESLKENNNVIYDKLRENPYDDKIIGGSYYINDI